MPTCWLVPGFLSSDLFYDEALTRKMWPDYWEISVGGPGQLRLAPDGTSPGPPDGKHLFAGGPSAKQWSFPAALLATQLAPHGYTVRQWGYDWRRAVQSIGVDLAASIRAAADPAAPDSIVAHSYGGLVARAAWSDLVRTGDTGLVRRIVTMGTAHQGTYYPVVAFSFQGELVGQFLYICNGLLGNGIAAKAFTILPSPSAIDIAAIVATWPAIYDLMPLLDSPDSAADPNRLALYTASNWRNGLTPSQTQLDRSRLETGPWLRSAASMPPSWVLTTVAGYGWSTAERLAHVDQLGAVAALGFTDKGDGVITSASAAVVDSQVADWAAGHNDMPYFATVGGYIAEWVLAVRSPPTPPPPPDETVLPAPTTFLAPPIADPIVSGGDGGCGPGGRCRC